LVAGGIFCLNHKKAIAWMQIDPTSEDDEQEMPWLKLRFHVPPDAR
jgi:hypothetical protein